MTDIKQHIAQLVEAAENQLETIFTAHKQNISNGSADPDEFEELHETAVENVALLKLIEKQIVFNPLK